MSEHTTPAPDNLPAAPGIGPDPIQIGERTGMFGATRGADTSGYGGLRSPIFFPGAAVRPYGSFFDEVADLLTERVEAGATVGRSRSTCAANTSPPSWPRCETPRRCASSFA